MITLYDFDEVISLYKDNFDLNAHYVRVLNEFLTYKLPSNVHNELIK
jgi:hypothetical protein